MKAGALRKLSRRFGIAAPKVAVRIQVPWYVRWLGIAVLLAFSAALAAWMYDAGRRFAGFDRREAEQEVAAMRREFDASRGELERLRALANAADSKLSIERTAQQKLAQQIRTLESDNARLREELAIFESMLSADGPGAAPLSIRRFKVEREMQPGEYRYRLLLLTSGLRRGEFKGRYELLIRLTENGRSAMITLPESADSPAPDFGLDFRRFRRLEGTFRVSPQARVENVQVRVYEAGSVQVRATETAQPG
ncbi:MAG: hypothetical protein HYX46_09245 [Betaproteobacteria bacterium]|nr:hypothetical protein [Betaproteobacteria bacterium]